MIKVAINGLGRIGRAVFKIILDTPELELVALNELVTPDNLAYLLKYDTVYGKYSQQVDSNSNSLTIAGKKYKYFQKKDPESLPWKDLDIDIVLPELANKFDGVAVRTPVPVGSISDIVIVGNRETSVEEINNIFREEAQTDKLSS